MHCWAAMTEICILLLSTISGFGWLYLIILMGCIHPKSHGWCPAAYLGKIKDHVITSNEKMQ